MMRCMSGTVVSGTSTTAAVRWGRIMMSLSTRSFASISSANIIKNLKAPTDSTISQLPDDKSKLQFGQTFTDHMLIMEWNRSRGTWSTPSIQPYQDLPISPAASCLHYGLQCFEGMKAYRSLDDPESIHLFRPDMNMKRLVNSMTRLHMTGPGVTTDFDSAELIDCIGELCRVEKQWIPYGEGYSLYLRPTVIATHSSLGMAPPDSLLLYVIACPVGPYYKSGFKPIKLLADSTYVRAWPGGTGAAKVGGNYASTIKPAAEASDSGYSQILWLFGPNDEVTEVGTMNVFFYLINKDTMRPELVTAPLWRGDILPGVTRASILDLARTGRLNENNNNSTSSSSSSSSSSNADFDVSERFITMDEIVDAANDGRLLEAFGAGTAAVVSPINGIHYKGTDYTIPATGEMTQRVWDELIGIQYRTKDAPPGWIVDVS